MTLNHAILTQILGTITAFCLLTGYSGRPVAKLGTGNILSAIFLWPVVLPMALGFVLGYITRVANIAPSPKAKSENPS